MTQEFSTDDLTDTELLKRCIMSLSDTILYTDMLIDRQYKLEVKLGTKLLKGKITEQDVVDIGAIGLALILRRI